VGCASAFDSSIAPPVSPNAGDHHLGSGYQFHPHRYHPPKSASGADLIVINYYLSFECRHRQLVLRCSWSAVL